MKSLIAVALLFLAGSARAETCYTISDTSARSLAGFIAAARAAGVKLEAASSTDTVHGHVNTVVDSQGRIPARAPVDVCFYDAAVASRGDRPPLAVHASRKTILATLRGFLTGAGQ